MLKFFRSPFWLGLAHLVAEKNPLEATGEREPPHVKIDEILEVDYHANDAGLPCVRVKTSYNDGKDIATFNIYTYLDFERRFTDPIDAIKRIINSIPCKVFTGGSFTMSWDCYAIPREYRTQWGLVKHVDW